jgi:hypothetical protein
VNGPFVISDLNAPGGEDSSTYNPETESDLLRRYQPRTEELVVQRSAAGLNSGTATSYTVYESSNFIAPFTGTLELTEAFTYGFSGGPFPCKVDFLVRLLDVTDSSTGVTVPSDLQYQGHVTQFGIYYNAAFTGAWPIVEGRNYTVQWWYQLTPGGGAGVNTYIFGHPQMFRFKRPTSRSVIMT